MKIQKNDIRKATIISFAKENCADSITAGWNQESNADCIARRVIALAKQAGVSGEPLKAFATELIADLCCGGIGLYGNASQFKQILEGKEKRESTTAPIADFLAGYGIE